MVNAPHDTNRLLDVWNQTKTPVVLRRPGRGAKVRVRLPYAKDNRFWLKNGNLHDPHWIDGDGKRYWEIPKAWFNDFVARALEKYGQLYVIQPYREQEKCAPACMNAVGHECQCSCMGQNHGAGQHGHWFVVSDTFAMRWGRCTSRAG